jgi:putative endonuclease
VKVVYYVYVITDEKEIYIGYSSDLRKRIEAHNKGLNRSTKNRSWRLVYYEAYSSEKDARKREEALKQSG